ncbi:MAG: hypothetical protein FJ004_06315 [Chloroflexi bacterium]|nr:hypothetical protein [Chloroflexota bacterium]
MKIGNLQFKEYAAKKPLTVSTTGEFLNAKEILAQPTLSLGSLHALSTNLQLKLALARYTLEPDFKLAIIGVGVLTKDEVIEHLKAQTEFGQLALQAEMQYCNELISALVAGTIPTRPTVPEKPIPKIPDWKIVRKCVWLRLKTRALFCENTTDSVTKPFANYRIENIHPVFQARGFSLVVLKDHDNVRINFVPQAKSGLTVYLSGVGHGNYTTYTGHGGNHILEVGKYDAAEVKDKAIHFLSCQTAAQLGPDTVTKGAKSYAGYTENFILQWNDPSTPAIDEFLLFAKSDSTFDIMMANGSTAQQAYDATIQAFNAAISQVPNTVAATYLTWDRDHLKLHGAPTTKIQPYRWVKICFPFRNLEKQDLLVAAGEFAE